jgi:class 3 adenylate cyclase
MSVFPRETRLQVSIAALFAALILPALGVIIAVSYYANERTLREMSQGFMDRARDDAVASVAVLLEPVVSALRIVAAVEANQPGYFRSDSSGDVLYRALQGAPQMDAIYTSFDDGYHRVVTRIDDDRRRSDPRILPNANWHMSWIAPYDAAGTRSRVRHRTFYATWPHLIDQYDVIYSQDVRDMPQYRAAHDRHAVAVSEPTINPDTGAPIIAVGYPIERDGLVVGIVTANITMGALSEFLASHRASLNAITVIANRLGTMIAHPVPAQVVRRDSGRLTVAKISELQDAQIVAAAAERARRGQDRFTFTEPDGREYAALFSAIPDSTAWDWEVAVVAPTDDFVGALRRTSQLLILVMLAVALVESVLIHYMARMISRPIEAVSAKIEEVRSLQFGAALPASSRIREIGQLQRALVLLNNALRSFSAFVPVDIVRGLIESGHALTPGVEHRFMTMLFSDVEGFTTLSEELPPQQLSEQTSSYFETVTSALAEEGATIDKFIGDAVMAFWGAPKDMDDHPYRACVAALRASRRMERLNARWAAEGRKPMRTRFGIHCADVVVGNVGSQQRLSYTVMGDGVNVASRVEGLNKQFGSSICISESIFELVKGRVVTRPLGKVAVKGRKKEIMVYELLGIAGSTNPELVPNAN